MHKLEELKYMLCEELEEYGSKDKLDVGGLEIVDKLAHAIKNIDKIIESEEGYSERRGSYRGVSYEGGYDGGSYGDSYRGYSSRRGRGRNARRDSMGRYSRANDMMVDQLREMMDDATDEQTRMEFERFIQKMEQR